jgi:hypothetical protein
MKSILTGTFAAFVLGAAIVSSQTPSQQTPGAAQPGGQTQPGGPTTKSSSPTSDQRNAMAKGQTQTYKGYLRGSEAGGWTIQPMRGTAGTAGATATAGATPVTYSVMVPEGTKVNLTTMADKCVEIVGMLAPEAAGATSTPGAAGAPAAGATSRSSASAHRALNVTTIKSAEGCTP